jgi:hypothetical protein
MDFCFCLQPNGSDRKSLSRRVIFQFIVWMTGLTSPTVMLIYMPNQDGSSTLDIRDPIQYPESSNLTRDLSHEKGCDSHENRYVLEIRLAPTIPDASSLGRKAQGRRSQAESKRRRVSRSPPVAGLSFSSPRYPKDRRDFTKPSQPKALFSPRELLSRRARKIWISFDPFLRSTTSCAPHRRGPWHRAALTRDSRALHPNRPTDQPRASTPGPRFFRSLFRQNPKTSETGASLFGLCALKLRTACGTAGAGKLRHYRSLQLREVLFGMAWVFYSTSSS